jgi:hypothetical protein
MDSSNVGSLVHLREAMTVTVQPRRGDIAKYASGPNVGSRNGRKGW